MFGIFDIALNCDIALPELPEVTTGRQLFTVRQGHRENLDESTVQWFHDWLESSGEISISGGRIDENYLLRFPALADFIISIGDSSIVYIPEKEVPEATIRHLLLDQVIPRILGQAGWLVLHASAIRLSDGTGIAFLGDSGWGKSTLAASYLGTDAQLITDDCLMLDITELGVTGVANYYGARLYPDSASALFEQPHSSSTVAHYSDKRRITLPPGDIPTEYALKLHALFVLNDPTEQRDISEVAIAQLTGTSALMSIIKQTFSLDVTDKGVYTNQFANAGKITSLGSEIFSLTYPRHHRSLPQVQKAVRETIACIYK